MLGRSKSLKKTSSGQISSLGMSISEEGPAVGVVEPASASSSSPAADCPPSHVPTGLVNDGNTCFLNSVFQSIIHTPPLNVLLTPNDMLEMDTLPFSPEATIKVDRQRCPALMSERNEHLDLMPLTASFVEAAGRSWRTELKGLENADRRGQGLKTLLYNMSKKHDQYGDYDQQDSHELLRHLLDSIRMEEVDVIKRLKASKAELSPETASVASSSRETASVASSIPVPNTAPVPRELYTDDTPAEERDDLVSFVDLLFGGRLASMVVCGVCKSVSHTYEDFMDLSMSLPGEAPKERKRDRLRSMASKLRAKLTKPDNYDNDSSAVASDEEDDAPAAAPTDEQARSFSSRRMTSTADDSPKRVPGSRRMTVDNSSGPPSSSNLGRRNSILSAFGSRRKSVSRRSSAAQSEAMSLSSRPGSPASEDADTLISPAPTPFSTSALLTPNLDPSSAEARFPKLKPSQAAYISQILGGPPVGPGAAQHIRSLSMSASASAPPSPSIDGSGVLPPTGGQHGLIDALRQFTSVEVLDGENAFACKKCWRFEHPRRDGKVWRRGGERVDDSDDDEEQDGALRDGVENGEDSQTLEAIKDVDEAVEEQARLRESDIQALAELHLNEDEEVPATVDLTKLDTKLAEAEGLPPKSLSSVGAAEAVLENPSIPTTSFGGPPHPQHNIPSIIETPFSPTDENPPDLSAAKPASPNDSTLHLPPRSSRAKQPNLSRGHSYTKHSNPEYETVEQSDSDNSDASSMGGTDDEATGTTTPSSKAPKGPRSIMRRAFKRYLIVNPPPILVFHLKRFEQIFGGKGFSPFGGFTTNFKKIDNYVSFPLTIDIAPFFAPARVGAPATTTNLSAKAKRTVHDVSDSVNYELTAVVVHLGSMGGGHYISYVLSSPEAPPPLHPDSDSPVPPTIPTPGSDAAPEDSAPPSTVNSASASQESLSSFHFGSLPQGTSTQADPRVWFYCSDTVVKRVQVDEVLNARAYLLFYQRI